MYKSMLSTMNSSFQSSEQFFIHIHFPFLNDNSCVSKTEAEQEKMFPTLRVWNWNSRADTSSPFVQLCYSHITRGKQTQEMENITARFSASKRIETGCEFYNFCLSQTNANRATREKNRYQLLIVVVVSIHPHIRGNAMQQQSETIFMQLWKGFAQARCNYCVESSLKVHRWASTKMFFFWISASLSFLVSLLVARSP